MDLNTLSVSIDKIGNWPATAPAPRVTPPAKEVANIS
jgi:hypothetical protein